MSEPLSPDLLALLDTLDGLYTKAESSETSNDWTTYIASLSLAYPRLAQALRTALTPTTDGEREAREALAKTEEPPRHVHSWRLVCDQGHEVAGSSAETEPPHWATWSTRCEECDYNFADENAYDFTVTHHEWDVTPDQKVDAAHLRTALTLLAAERAKAADAARERAAIVAWLREQASEMVKLNQHDDVRLRGAAYLNTARAIERGAHTKVTP
jgi:hypothetical protein